MAKLLTGTVVSTKMQKTIVVEVERRFRHSFYGKVIARSKKYKVHYEGNSIKEGDEITIREVKPISKDKQFIVHEAGSETKAEAVEKKPKIEKKEVKKRTTKAEKIEN